MTLEMSLSYIALSLSIVSCTLNLIATAKLKKNIQDIPLGKMIIQFTVTDLILFTSHLALLAIFGHLTEPLGEASWPKVIIYFFLIFWSGFGFAGSLLWGCCMAHYLYYQGKGSFKDHWFLRYVLISYSTGIANGILNVFIYAEWRRDPLDWVFMKVAWAVIVSIVTTCFLVSLTFYVKGIALMWQRRNPIPWMLLIYPLILVICPLPTCFIVFVCAITENQNPNPVLVMVCILIWELQGFVNALVYGLISELLAVIKEKCTLRKTQKRLTVTTDSDDEEEDSYVALSRL